MSNAVARQYARRPPASRRPQSKHREMNQFAEKFVPAVMLFAAATAFAKEGIYFLPRRRLSRVRTTPGTSRSRRPSTTGASR
ncbi:hypothetical protein PSAB6_580005 [Paraburkholderia sabiae]|nr:hypothetical protein PSAB6_580005 [Paraburkholderia sabiae]